MSLVLKRACALFRMDRKAQTDFLLLKEHIIDGRYNHWSAVYYKCNDIVRDCLYRCWVNYYSDVRLFEEASMIANLVKQLQSSCGKDKCKDNISGVLI